MKCETCQGERKVCVKPVASCVRASDAYEPCPECNGSGITSCCEGACGGPGEVTNGVAEAVRESYDQQPDYYVVHRGRAWGLTAMLDMFLNGREGVTIAYPSQRGAKDDVAAMRKYLEPPTKQELAWKRELARHGVEVWL